MKRYHKKIFPILILSAALISIFIIPASNCGSEGQVAACGYQSAETDACDYRDKTADSTFTAYINDLFCQEIAATPLTLHYTLKYPENYGITAYSTSLGIYSAENITISAALAESVISVLQEFDTDSLSAENQLVCDILEDSLTLTVDAASFPYYEEPLRPSTGIQSELPILLAEYAFDDRQDVCDYLEILGSIPAYFRSICVYEKEKYDSGLFMSDFTAKTIAAQCEDFAGTAEDNYLLYTFEEKLEALTDLTANERAAYIRQNQSIVTQEILPAFQEIADTLTGLVNTDTVSDYEKAGLSHLPQGSSYYAFLVKQASGSSDNIKTLKKRVESQRASDLLDISSLMSENPSLDTEILSADAPSDKPEEILELLKEAIALDFPAADSCSYTVKYVDAAMEDYLSPAFYLTSPLDDCTQNTICINSGSGYEGIRLFTTLAHEGYPGHLYQNAYFCGTDPSPIRALLGPAGYSEGWATYVELLSYQYAGLPEEAAQLLELEQSVILSLYASADFGIHADGWSLSDTFSFFSDYGFTDEETVREIYELITAEPAHYLKYYIGYLEFLNLKEYARELGGANYTDLAFHQAVLTIGPAPFSILKKYLPVYLEECFSS